jgi:hypothetical protein
MAMKTVRTNFDHRDLPSHVFSKNRIPADLQQFMRKRIIPKLKLRGYKLAEKRSIAMQAIHNLLMAWSVGACVRDTRNARLRGVQLRVGVWDAIVNAGFATKCLDSESSGKQTRCRATEKLLALRSCWDLRLTVGSDLKRNTELSKPTWKALVVLHSGRFDLATGKRLPDGARKRLISIPDYIATTVQRNSDGRPDKRAIQNKLDHFRGIEDEIELINLSNLEHSWQAFRTDPETGSRCVFEPNPCLRQFHVGEPFRGIRLYSWGRFSGQNLPKEVRRTMLIDEEKVAELDFSGMATRMLYHFRGLDRRTTHSVRASLSLVRW